MGGRGATSGLKTYSLNNEIESNILNEYVKNEIEENLKAFLGNPKNEEINTDVQRSVYKSKGEIIALYENSNFEENANIEALKDFADKGYTIQLIKPINKQNIKTADAIINNQSWEIKTNITSTTNAIENAIKDAKKQSHNIILNVKSGISDKDILSTVRYRINRSSSIKNVIVERNGEIKYFLCK